MHATEPGLPISASGAGLGGLHGPGGRGRRLVRVSGGGAAVTLAIALTAVVTTPYIVGSLGRPAYGIFALTSALAAQLGNLEFGFGYSTVRFLTAARAREDHDDARRVLSTSLCVFLAGGLIGGITLACVAGMLARSYANVPPGLVDEATAAFRLTGVIVFASFVTAFFRVALQAIERFAIIVGYQAVSGGLSTVLAIGVLVAGGSLVAVVVSQTVLAVANAVVLGVIAQRAWGFSIAPRPSRSTFVTLARFGVVVFAGGVGYQLFVNGPLTVLGGIVAAGVVPAFSIPATVMQRLAMVGTSTSLALFPFLSASSALQDEAALRRGFLRHLRLSLLGFGLIAAYLVVFSEPVLELWLGERLGRDATGSMQWLAVAALAVGSSITAVETARAVGRAGLVLVYTWTLAASAVGLSIALVPAHGASGAAFATAAALVPATIVLTVVVAGRVLRIRPTTLWQAVRSPLTAIALASGAFVLADRLVHGPAGALVTGVAVSLMFVVSSHKFVLDDAERAAFSLRRR